MKFIIKVYHRITYLFYYHKNKNKIKEVFNKYNEMKMEDYENCKKLALSRITGIPTEKIYSYGTHNYGCANGMFWVTTEHELRNDIDNGKVTKDGKLWKVDDFIIYFE